MNEGSTNLADVAGDGRGELSDTISKCDFKRMMVSEFVDTESAEFI
jgi:hypothetical protein